MAKTRISIIVPAYNEEKSISKCLESLIRQTDRDFELVVVNNNSTDRTAEVAKKFVKRVYLERKKGYHNAVKRGINETRGDVVAICDADTIYPRDWIQTAKEEFATHENAVAVYGLGTFYDAPKAMKWINENVYYGFMLTMAKLGVDVTNGFNFFIKRKAYLQAGGYDPKVYNSEGLDINLGARLKKIGEVHFSRKLTADTSFRRVQKEGLFNFIFTNLNMYARLLMNKPVKRSYDQYNDIKY
ncbi:hypothetical protein A3K62_02350 [Candidatus Pacearchaeota archaeon RBG_16_35_8]|nr:MAG: hypothetical protein A3K62_02350 [Candidatus Pacearchaeota archaeon RBG_16_35_8]